MRRLILTIAVGIASTQTGGAASPLTQALAGQQPPAITQPSAFLAGQVNILSQQTGQRIGIIRPSPFVEGESHLYSQPGDQRILLIQPSPFLGGQLNLYDLVGHD